ncbi:MAG: hypothetical protein LBV18_06285 [Alistipes sp.]|jgi:hypothetical protein|nr:hypothetical protein [Alistipes sp.]
MKKLFVLLAISIASISIASAQNYDNGVGLRLGWGGALDYKWNFSEKNSWEFNLAFPAFNGINASAAYQWNWPLTSWGATGANGQGFNVYVGPAAGVGYLGAVGFRGVMLGVGGHGGLEYKFGFPLAIGVDLKPMVTFITGDFTGVWANGFWDFGLVARYTF